MMKGGLGKLMKQAQEMQANMQKAQEELARTEFTGQSGGGMVSVTMNGRHDVVKVSIDDSLMNTGSSEDKEMLEDLIAAAVNDAVRHIEKKSKETMSSMTQGLPLPGDFKLPF